MRDGRGEKQGAIEKKLLTGSLVNGMQFLAFRIPTHAEHQNWVWKSCPILKATANVLLLKHLKQSNTQSHCSSLKWQYKCSQKNGTIISLQHFLSPTLFFSPLSPTCCSNSEASEIQFKMSRNFKCKLSPFFYICQGNCRDPGRKVIAALE